MNICKALNCCNTEWNLDSCIEYYRFPVDTGIREIWAYRAQIRLEDIDEFSALCSEHFNESCFDRSDPMAVILKDNSVPTIFEEVISPTSPLPDQMVIDTTMEILANNSDTDSQHSAMHDTGRTVHLDPLTGVEIEIKTELLEGHDENIVVEEIQCPTIDPVKMKPQKLKKKPPKKSKHISLKKALNETMTAVKSKHQASAILGGVEVLKKTCLKQITKIKILNQKVRRGNQQVEKLNQMLKEVKDQNQSLKKQLEDYATLPNISALSNDLMKRQLALKEGRELERTYPPEVRDFSINLNCFSPLAYRYVRESFNKVLPHKKTLSKWQSQEKTTPMPDPPESQLLPEGQGHDVTEETLVAISTKLENQNSDGVFTYVEQYIGLIPDQVRVMLSENGFDHLVTLIALKDSDIDGIIEKNSDLSEDLNEYLRGLPQLMQMMVSKMTESNDIKPQGSASLPITTGSPRKDISKTTASFNVNRSSVVLKNLVSEWLNKNTEYTRQYAKSDVVVAIDNTTIPMSGKVRCVVCLQDISVNMQKYKKSETYIRWVIANFVKHFKKFHITKSTEIILESITNEHGEIIAGIPIAPIMPKQVGRKRLLNKEIKQGQMTIAETASKIVKRPKKIKLEKNVVVVPIEKTEESVQVEYLDSISVANIFGNMYYTND